jgi:hypothetical protein
MRRKGVGSALMQRLMDEKGITAGEIMQTGLTHSGRALVRSMLNRAPTHLREYIRELISEAPTFKHKGSYDYFRVDLPGIGYAQGGHQLGFRDCQPDVDTLMQTPEYLAAEEKHAAYAKPRTRLERDESGKWVDKEIGPAKFSPRFYDVENAWIQDEADRGKGHGKEIYRAFIDKAVEYSKSAGGVFVGAHHCTIGSGTSPDAKRLWKSLTREYTASGDVIFIGL